MVIILGFVCLKLVLVCFEWFVCSDLGVLGGKLWICVKFVLIVLFRNC